MKGKRFFLEKDADSYVTLHTPEDDDYSTGYDLKMADCHRSIQWYFDKKKGHKKLKKFRDLINELYDELQK